MIRVYCDRCRNEIRTKPETTISYFVPVRDAQGQRVGRDGIHLCEPCTSALAGWMQYEGHAVIHVLHQGSAVCGQPGLPRDWPPDHKWVELDDWKRATCQTCVNEAKKESR